MSNCQTMELDLILGLKSGLKAVLLDSLAFVLWTLASLKMVLVLFEKFHCSRKQTDQ